MLGWRPTGGDGVPLHGRPGNGPARATGTDPAAPAGCGARLHQPHLARGEQPARGPARGPDLVVSIGLCRAAGWLIRQDCPRVPSCPVGEPARPGAKPLPRAALLKNAQAAYSRAVAARGAGVVGGWHSDNLVCVATHSQALLGPLARSSGWGDREKTCPLGPLRPRPASRTI